MSEYRGRGNPYGFFSIAMTREMSLAWIKYKAGKEEPLDAKLASEVFRAGSLIMGALDFKDVCLMYERGIIKDPELDKLQSLGLIKTDPRRLNDQAKIELEKSIEQDQLNKDLKQVLKSWPTMKENARAYWLKKANQNQDLESSMLLLELANSQIENEAET